MKIEPIYPFVSVIVPCRNEEKHIQRCLISLIYNKYPRDRFEIIVVDGMSEDDTPEILDCFMQTFSNMRLYENTKKTTPYAMNIGIQAASGDYFMRADARAEYPMNYIDRLIDMIEEEQKFSENNRAYNVGGILAVATSGGQLIRDGLNIIRNVPFGPQGDNFCADLIMIAGSHCEYPRDYITECVKRSGEAENVGGCIQAVNVNGRLMFRAVDTVRNDVFGIGRSEYRQGAGRRAQGAGKNIEPQSHRDIEPQKKIKKRHEFTEKTILNEGIEVDTVFGGCYRKEVFEKIGLFNEQLTRGQDLEFNLRLKRAGMKTKLFPDIVVKYYPKAEFWPFLKHAFEDGYWITNAMGYAENPVTLRHLVPMLFVMFMPFGIIPYIFVNLYRSGSLALRFRNWRFMLVLPWMFFLFHVTYGFGSVVGGIKTFINILRK